jgi:hypothetical protein
MSSSPVHRVPAQLHHSKIHIPFQLHRSKLPIIELHHSKLPILFHFPNLFSCSHSLLPSLLLLVFSCSLYLVKSLWSPPMSSSWSRTPISCHSHSNNYLWVLYSSIFFLLLVPSELWFTGVSCEHFMWAESSDLILLHPNMLLMTSNRCLNFVPFFA